MNPFQRARNEAKATREKLAPRRNSERISARELLSMVEEQLGIAIEQVAATFPDLGGGSAVLLREQRFIYVNKDIPLWGDKFCGLIAHELGHWFLDAEKSATKVADLKNLLGASGSSAVMKVEAYGAREREELQANVFARELLLPRELARNLSLSGSGPYEIAQQLGIPLDFVQLQMLDAMLLPDIKTSVNSLKCPSADQLTASQTDARAANVVAGPGTGKTTTLVHRVKHLIEEKKVDPGEILVLTFTNKAAVEIVERLRGAGIDRAADVWAGTFHAFGLEFLRKFHQRFGLDSDVHVVDHLASLSMLVAGLPRLRLKYYLRVEDPYDWLGPVVDAIKRLKEELVSPESYLEYIISSPVSDAELQRRREDVATLYSAHEKLLSERRSVDFVDLIAKPAMALSLDRLPFSDFANKFKHILVDEYQDVTQVMVELLRQLAHKTASIWVVGDIRQAIHHWRGASLKSLLKFEAEFKSHAGSSKIKRYALDTNRRSNQEVLNLIHEIGRQHKLEPSMPLDKMISAIGSCGNMPSVVTCKKREDVLGSVVENILELRSKDVPFGCQAVLCRRSSDIQQAAAVLADNGIPAIYIGELAQRPEVKRLLCLMQLLVERHPKALIGLRGVPGLAMPLHDIRWLLSMTASDQGYQRGRWLKKELEGLSTFGQDAVNKLRKLLGEWRHSSNPWDFICDMLLEQRFGLPDFEDDSVDAWVKRIALWQFAYAVRNGDGDRKEARLSRFLVRQRLRQRIGDGYVSRDLPPEVGGLDGVRLLTVHGSKGLEFDAVHLAYVNASSYGAQMPRWSPPENVLEIVPPEALGSSQKEFEFEAAVERNNLLYVAVSRAKHHLYLYQENEFGEDDLAPQLQHFPQQYESISSGKVPKKRKIDVALRAFEDSGVVQFECFDAYAMCALQYWYSQILSLKNEADVDPSVRARRAVMISLKEFSSGEADSPAVLLEKNWDRQRLPLASEDPALWHDANVAFSKGLNLVDSIMRTGGKFSEPKSVVGGITVQMPWGFVIKRLHYTEFAMVRFSRRRASSIATLLKPMVSGLMLDGTKKLTLNYVLSDKFDDVPGAKRVELTKGFKAAVRMLAGENSPTVGRHCARCGYSTICPSASHV